MKFFPSSQAVVTSKPMRLLVLAAALFLASLGLGAQAAGSSPGTAPQNPALEVANRLGLGWNLGNSLDSIGRETSWGNPRVSRELIHAVKAAGFNTVRIPVSWTKHFKETPDFTIDPIFMNRVAEVLGWVLDEGMYAIINLHHDGADGGNGAWLLLEDAQGEVTMEHDDAVQAKFEKIWMQIAAKFRDTSDHLIFESMNEIHVGYGSPMEAYYSTINNLNQDFVKVIRASGGNNENRLLLVPGYNTNINYTLAGFEMPEDMVRNRIAVSVHFYDPWDFAGAGKSMAWGEGNPGSDRYGQETFVASQFNALRQAFIDKGIPVIMGEYGAVNHTGAEKYRRYYMEYVTKAAHDRGIVPVYWDNGSRKSGEEAFGLFDRASYEVLYPDILAAMIRGISKVYQIKDIAKP